MSGQDYTDNTSEHPSVDELVCYLEKPDSPDFDVLREHLITCHQCRQQVANLSTTIDLLTNKVVLDNADLSLSDAERELKASMHYATHSAAMNRHIDLSKDLSDDVTIEGISDKAVEERSKGVPKGVIPQVAKESLGGRIWSFCQQLLTARQPMWATAVLVLVVVFFIGGENRDISGVRVATFQDQPELLWSSSWDPAGGAQNGAEVQPGIGFFRQQVTETQAYGEVLVSAVNEERLRIQWPPVEGADGYTLNVSTLKDGRNEFVFEASTSGIELIVDRMLLKNRKHYKWVLSGSADDGRLFTTSGGFVLTD